MSNILLLDRIGVGIDTARYGHRVSFLRPDRQPAAKPLTVLENHDGYLALRERLEGLHQQHPQAQFHVRIDAAGQYAANLEHFLRGLNLPLTVSIGEPKRNKDYQKAHFPKRTSDDTESQAMARFAVVEQPPPTQGQPQEMIVLREVAGRLQAQVKQTTQAVNRLHNLLARVFPELATLSNDIAARWVLTLLEKYPGAERIAQAQLSSLQKIPYLPDDKAQPLHQAAKTSVASLRGPVAQQLVRNLVAEVRRCQQAEQAMRELLETAFAELPASGHQQLATIPGIGTASAAILTAKIVDIKRFATPNDLVGYFGVFPEENSSGVDKHGQPLPAGTLRMSVKGNDLVRFYLWNAARVGICHNPALRALYRRLKAKGKRGDVALGHCMRKLLHLVFAVWTTNRPFDEQHFPWEPAADDAASAMSSPASAEPSGDISMSSKSSAEAPAPTMSSPGAAEPIGDIPMSSKPPAEAPAPKSANDKAAGHKREQVPTEKVVTTASSTVKATAASVNPSAPTPAKAARPKVDFAFLRQQVTLEQVLDRLGLLSQMRGPGPQRRGRCPIHADAMGRTFSVHLGKNVFQCFDAACAAQGNVLDLWAAVHRLPLYDAALHLAATFNLTLNREEEPVK